MFVPTILGQCTTDQQAEWLGRAWNLEILGTYAQVSLNEFYAVQRLRCDIL